MFWQLNISIPRTRWTKSNWTTYVPNLNNFSFSQIVDYFIQTVVTLMSMGNTFQDIKFFFQIIDLVLEIISFQRFIILFMILLFNGNLDHFLNSLLLYF